LHYWRTNHGAEVNVLLCAGNRIVCALEIKSSRRIASESLTGLKSFLGDNPEVPAYVLGIRQKRRRLANGVTVMDWQDFIAEHLESEGGGHQTQSSRRPDQWNRRSRKKAESSRSAPGIATDDIVPSGA